MKDIKIDAILFDLDGVLVDSTLVIKRHWQKWADKHCLELKNIMEIAHGRTTVDTIQIIRPDLDAKLETENIIKEEAIDTNGLFEINGAYNLLSQLPSDAWAIATAGTKITALTRLEYCNLPTPNILVTADDIKKGKPNPEPYLLAAKLLNINPENCIVIEDAPAGIEAAHAANIDVIAVASTHQTSDLNKADYIIKKLTDISITKNSKYDNYKLTLHLI